MDPQLEGGTGPVPMHHDLETLTRAEKPPGNPGTSMTTESPIEKVDGMENEKKVTLGPMTELQPQIGKSEDLLKHKAQSSVPSTVPERLPGDRAAAEQTTVPPTMLSVPLPLIAPGIEDSSRTHELDDAPVMEDSVQVTEKVVLIGNPGVGKSAILNTLLGETRFKSGISLGQGLTTEMETHTIGNVEYVDTPGLDDVDIRLASAKEISAALTGEAEVKLIFVTTLEAGRVRVADLATLDVILTSLEETGVDITDRYSIIINKCEPRVRDSLMDENPAERTNVLAPFNYIRNVAHVAVIPTDKKALGGEDMILQSRDGLLQFVSEAPAFHLSSDQQVNVDVRSYDAKKERLQKEASELRKALEKALKQRDRQTQNADGPLPRNKYHYGASGSVANSIAVPQGAKGQIPGQGSNASGEKEGDSDTLDWALGLISKVSKFVQIWITAAGIIERLAVRFL